MRCVAPRATRVSTMRRRRQWREPGCRARGLGRGNGDRRDGGHRCRGRTERSRRVDGEAPRHVAGAGADADVVGPLHEHRAQARRRRRCRRRGSAERCPMVFAADSTQTSIGPSGPLNVAVAACCRFRQHGDDRQAGRAGPSAERQRVGRLGDEPVEIGGGAVAGEQDRRRRPRRRDEAADHVEGGAGVPRGRAREVTLAEPARSQVRAQARRWRGTDRSSTVRRGCGRWC